MFFFIVLVSNWAIFQPVPGWHVYVLSHRERSWNDCCLSRSRGGMFTCCHTEKERGMSSVSTGHIKLTPVRPVWSFAPREGFEFTISRLGVARSIDWAAPPAFLPPSPIWDTSYHFTYETKRFLKSTAFPYPILRHWHAHSVTPWKQQI